MKKSITTLKNEAEAATKALAEAAQAECESKKTTGLDCVFDAASGEILYRPMSRLYTRSEIVALAREVMESEGWEF